jgi:hypothetical protein
MAGAGALATSDAKPATTRAPKRDAERTPPR